MTKSYALLLAIICLLAACDKHEDAQQNPDNINYTLRFGHDMPADSAHHVAALRYAEWVEQKSHGQIRITVHPAQTLGNDHEMIAMAQAGQLDIILPPTAKLSSLDPAFQLFDLPYLFNNRTEAYKVMDGPAGIALLKKLNQQGLVGISFWESGFKQLTTNRPVNRRKDLDGMKFRIMRSDVIRDQFKSWGADSLPIEFSKTRQALLDGIVNGEENPLGTIYNMKFHEARSNLILSNHGYLAQVLAISKKTFERLPPTLQKILLNTGLEVTAFQRKEAQRREQDYLSKIKQSSITVSELDHKTQQQLKARSHYVLENQRLTIGTDIVQLAQQTLDELRNIDNTKLVIALDADLAGISAISGLAIRRGIEMAIREINAKGGVLGKQLQLIGRDNSMVSARGLDNLKYFKRIPNLVAVFSGISSPVALSELDYIHKNKILFLDPWAAATDIVENNYRPNYVFRLSVRDEYAAHFLVKQARQQGGDVALLLVNNPWGRSNHSSITQAMTKMHIKPVIQRWFDWGDKHLDTKLDDIARSSARVIIYVGNVLEAARVVSYMAKNKIKLPIISHWGAIGGDLLKMSGAALDKVDLSTLLTFSFIHNKRPYVLKAAKLYKTLFGINKIEDIPAAVGTAQAYDLTHLLVRAIRKAGRPDMPAIRNALEHSGRYRGLVRTYNPAFTASRHEALDEGDYFLANYQHGILIPVK